MKPPLTTAAILDALQAHRSDLDRLGVKTIALFGSYAKGAQTASSDLDFVVEFSAPTFDNFAGLDEFLRELFGRPVAIVTPAGIDSIRVPSVADDIRRTLVHV
jgi:predicted nucleotidyltransferase